MRCCQGHRLSEVSDFFQTTLRKLLGKGIKVLLFDREHLPNDIPLDCGFAWRSCAGAIISPSVLAVNVHQEIPDFVF
jgi:hypothetical protein